MDEASTIKEVEAQALRIAPRAVPQRPLGTGSALAGTASPGPLGPRGPLRPSNAHSQPWTATTVGSHERPMPLDLLPGRCHVQDRQARRCLVRHRVHALAAQRYATAVTAQGGGGCLRHFGH